MFIPAWRTIYCRFCGATFRLPRVWRWVFVTIPALGVPAFYVVVAMPDSPYRMAALLVLGFVVILNFWLSVYPPIVRTGQRD